MPTFLDDIREGLESVNPAALLVLEPKTEVGPREHVVGEVDEDLRRLFVLAMRWKNEESRPKFKLLMEIFWFTVVDAFDLRERGAGTLEIRKGWQIVWSEPEEATAYVVFSLAELMKGASGTCNCARCTAESGEAEPSEVN